ncbi:hypothetical protein [Streptomyces murinus]|nr:hypothetical protein [Streptomyces murinus]
MSGAGPRAHLSVLRHTMVFQLRQQHILSAVIPGCVVPAALCLATLLARGPHSLLTARQIELGCGVLALWSCAIWQTGLILREELHRAPCPASSPGGPASARCCSARRSVRPCAAPC